jgi:hydrogenase maturation protease
MTSERSQSRALVIGVGNAERGDDAVGLIVARRVRAAAPSGVTVAEASGEGAALIETWKGAEAVILIDAVHSGSQPGTVHRLEAVAQPMPASFFHCSTHAFGVAEAIELARALGALPRSLVVYGIEGETFAAGAALSPAAEQAVRQVMERVLEELRAGRHPA